MHSASTVKDVLDLGGQGRSASEIARLTGVSRSSVRGWLAGDTPHSAGGAGSGCSRCGGDAHNPESVAAQYAYLLGMYLGDGCIATHPRGVYKLRLSLDASYPSIIEECRAAMAAVAPRGKVGQVARSGGFENSVPAPTSRCTRTRRPGHVCSLNTVRAASTSGPSSWSTGSTGSSPTAQIDCCED